MKDGMVKLCAATPVTALGDPRANAAAMAAQIREAWEHAAHVVVFPELSLTGYTCGDLFHQRLLLEQTEEALRWLMAETASLDLLCAVGLPVAKGGQLHNCCAVFHLGKLLGLVTKTFLPNYGEFSEGRLFTPGCAPTEFAFAGQQTMLGQPLLFPCATVPELVVGVELCEDFWTACPPSVQLAELGATVILNLSCSDETVGKASYRRQLVTSQSARLVCAYAYADGGQGESTTDLVFSGHNLIGENGLLLGESPLFSTGLLYAEADLEALTQERRRLNTWGSTVQGLPPVSVPFSLKEETILRYLPERVVPKSPFVPQEVGERGARCKEVLSIQVQGLCGRLRHVGAKDVVLALSGGLDSTLALLVCVEAFRLLDLPLTGIHAVSMPCFGTTDRTKTNAQRMAEALGVDFREIPIGEAVEVHFRDIGQGKNQDVTYENAQARERTQVVMDLAGMLGGFMVGTGDLSELALGWSTYNGDHMSMYGVNAAVPKTLLAHLVRTYALESQGALGQVLLDVLDTPVSPELLPPKEGEISQKTEELVGPYALHDFFLFYFLRYGFSPEKIFSMACRSFRGDYLPEEIKKWLGVFVRRFFSQQFKRSCLPDGPKVGAVSLSPRGDWRMPSDAKARLWIEAVEQLSTEEKSPM